MVAFHPSWTHLVGGVHAGSDDVDDRIEFAIIVEGLALHLFRVMCPDTTIPLSDLPEHRSGELRHSKMAISSSLGTMAYSSDLIEVMDFET